jgi:hypothetical protein
MGVLLIIFIIFFVVDIVATTAYNHYKRIDNKLTKEQNEILLECYKRDAEIIKIDHKIINILREKDGGKINE